MTMGTTSDRDQALVGDALLAEAGMKAVVQRRYGPPEVLEYTDVGRPVVGDGDVLVGVRAASVHPGDYFVMTGVPSIVRLAFGLRRPRHPIPGRDLAGVVEAVGAAVTDLQPGDEVFGWSTAGTLAQYASVPADQLVRKPEQADDGAGGHGANVGDHRTAGSARHRARATGAHGARHGRIRGRRDVRRADRQGVGRRGDRGVQHPQRGAGPVAGRRRTSSTTRERTSPRRDGATTSSSTTWKRNRCRRYETL